VYSLVEDADKVYRETMQEVMLELKIKTEEFLKKLKEQAKKNRINV
jgi:vacuolar-type H+-ATPase subunit H